MKKTLFIVCLFSLVFAGCEKFSQQPQEQCFIPYVDLVSHHVNTSTLDVSFVANVVPNGTIISRKWDFGDGTTVNGTDTMDHHYRAAGTYTVKYTVVNECGEAFWTKEITISNCLPDTKFSFEALNDSTVQFTNLTKSGSSTQYLWNFGDGSTSSSNDQRLTHVYKGDKDFTVSLKASNACGENSFSASVSVCRKPIASQKVSVSDCGKVEIDASATTNGSKYQWDFGNGTVLPQSPQSSPDISYTYPKSGNYTIKLTVSNGGGCASATTSTQVNIKTSSLAGNSNWSYHSDDLAFSFSREAVAGASSYTWDFGDGTRASEQNPSKTYDNPGRYTLKVTAANSCGNSYEFSAPVNVPYFNPLANTPRTGFRQVIALNASEIYFLGQDQKLYKTDTAGNWSPPIELPQGLHFDNATKLFRDFQNNLWIYGKGEVAQFQPSSGSWDSWFSKTGFSDRTTIMSMAIDQKGELWTIGDGKLHKGREEIKGKDFSALAYSTADDKIWLVSRQEDKLFFVPGNSGHVNEISISELRNGGDDIRVYGGDIYFTSGSGIIRTNSSGAVTGTYTSNTTNDQIPGRPADYDSDTKGNLWVVYSGHVYKVPLNNSGNTKNYSFTSELDKVSSLSVLKLSNSDNDILLAKTSGNAATKIR